MTQTNSNPLLTQPQLTEEYLARVALDNSPQHLEQLQDAVEQVTAQSQTGQPLNPAALEFLTALFNNPWWGGKDLGYNHAQQHFGQDVAKPIADLKQPYWAQMQEHFVRGSGHTFTVNRQLYQTSIIVRDVINALKSYIKKQHQQQRAIHLIATSSNDFLMCPEALKLEESRRSAENLGYLFNDGSLCMEQKDPRLNRLFDRFKIAAYSSQQGHQIMTRWRIEGLYSFASPALQTGRTGLVLSENCVLTVPFSLGQLLATQGGAKDYTYFTEWMEWH